MENTTKALMMAAGVLLGVIILSLAVYLVNSMKSFSRNYNDSLEQQQLEQFNAKFIVFEGRENISSHEIATLVNLAKEFNDTNFLDAKNNDSQSIHIKVNLRGTGNTYTDLVLTENSNILNKLLDGSYFTYIGVPYGGIYYTQQNKDANNKVISVTYYNCYRYDSCTINPKTGRVEEIKFTYLKEKEIRK